MSYNNSYWAAVYLNLCKYWRRWGMISRVLERMGASVRAWGEIYKAVAQSVLLYGSNIWVVTGEMLKVLMAFQNQAAQQITGMTENCGAGGEWEYPAVYGAMDAVGIHPIGVYTKRRQTKIAERVECNPIYALWTEAERIPGKIRMVHWWDKDTVNEP